MVDYPHVVNASFVSRYGDGKNFTPAQRMNIRSELAKKLVSTHYANLSNELERKAAEHHEKLLDEWKLDLQDISEAEDVSRYVAPFFSSVNIANLYFPFTAPAIHSLKPFILSSAELAHMPTAMFRSLSVVLERTSQTMAFSPRRFDASFGAGILLTVRKVFIGGQETATNPRVGRNGIQKGLTPELLVRSSSTLQKPVRRLRFSWPRHFRDD